MTLDEIFEKYPDEQEGFYRENNFNWIKHFRPDYTEQEIKNLIPKYSVKWLKMHKAWGNQKSRDMGFIIPDFMIKDANADDWVLDESST